ncbi:MAG: hypothetical protein AAFZ65_18050 [Planctomycetota bacterium]
MLEARVTDVAFAGASSADRDRGLLGWVRLRAGDLLVDGIAVRRTRGGRLTLSWPSRRSSSGASFAYVRPINDRARAWLEEQVLDQLRLDHGDACGGR